MPKKVRIHRKPQTDRTFEYAANARDLCHVIEGYGEKPAVPTDIFDSEYFAQNYHYEGDDLGACINGDTTTFKVWAPTASRVVLNLFTAGDGVEAYKNVDMVKGEKGVWSHTEDCGHGTYYTYSVTTSVGTQEAVDPYAKAAGVNGDRGMVVDLSLTDPEGWNEAEFESPISSYSEAIIWEVHVRDFSNKIESSEYKGKYLAFTETGLVNEYGQPVGVDYLKELGVTHIHLLPVYDYASVDERTPEDEFNWGYDPENYNCIEGSYSTDPYNGAVRVKEFKQMVQALHEAGIGVIMDVVYNHTFDKNASFNKIVPYYYYRYKANGANSSGSGCGNDTASERYMYGKFMVESVSYWQQEYHLDGFRFDLMGLHDMETMQAVESVVHNYDPQAIIYGEGWQMMVNAYGAAVSAHQGNIDKIKPTNGAIGTIAVFNDTMRVGLKGESDDATRGYISGDQSKMKRVLFGVLGGPSVSYDSWWKVNNDMVVNYLSAHDNSTLWDKLAISNGSQSVDMRLKMNRLGASILFMSEGIVFFQAGEEMLRSKPNPKSPHGFDHNSYKSSDEVNNLKWDTLDGTGMYSQMVDYYAGLCAIRTQMSIFTDHTSFEVYTHQGNSGFNIVMKDGKGGVAIAVFNPHAYSIKFTPQGANNMICDGTVAGLKCISTVNGEVSVPGYSAMIFVNDQVLNSAGK